MPDAVTLTIGSLVIDRFRSYRVEADLWTAADAFSLELAPPFGAEVAGQECRLTVNGKTQLSGIIDSVTTSCDKESGIRVSVSGRDLMGLLVDASCEEFIDLQGVTLQALTERLIRKIPFIRREQIVYQENVVGRGKKKGKAPASSLLDTPQAFSRIEPGMKVFDALRDYALSRGLLFYALPDGTFVYGRPPVTGEPGWYLTNRKDGRRNNVISGVKRVDLAPRYRTVVALGQQQGTDALNPGQITTRHAATDPTFPWPKTLVVKNNNDYQSGALHARLLLEKQRHAGFSLEYTVAGHSQGGDVWQIGEFCQVEDEALEVRGLFLIYGRTLELDRHRGPITTLRLGLPGMVSG